jgi:hypothetical protein
MKASASTLVVGLLLSVALPSGIARASDPGEQLLLERANYWREQHRLELAGQILNKLLALNPDQPDALYQQGLLATERGDRGAAQQYFDRLRQLAPSDKRAAELLGAPSSPKAAPAPAVTVAATAPNPPAIPAKVAPASQAAPGFVVASADSDDLLPSKPAAPTGASRPVVVPGTIAQAAQARQVASLPQAAASDGDVSISTIGQAARPAGAADLGITAKAVQVSQVELQPPLPVGGYQLPVNVTPYSPTDTLEMDIDRNLIQLQTQANPMLIAGAGFRWHDGTSGINQLTEFGTPIQGSFSPWYTGTATLAVLPVYLDAGSISSTNLGQFGANPILSAASLPLVSPGAQNAAGVGILGGYSWGDFGGQIGTSPLGFPVTNIVGNVAYAPKFLDGTLSVRIEGLRQPVTDSVLSYAGTHANFSTAKFLVPAGAFGTSNTWGGVVKTGGHVTAFYDDQMYGAYGGAGLASLTGMNVAQNSQLDALLGAYFRPWKTDNWAIRVGIAGYYTSYNKNLDGFTFGQGGYFSPQNFESLTFPVEYTGHDGPWSWLASVALGVQHFNTDSSPIFPHNPGAQAALAQLTTATTFSGGTSTGLGVALNGQIEYAVDNSLTLGAAASFNNGNDYDEVIAKVYLRKTFDWFAPVAVKNTPEAIVARDQPMSRL